MIDTKSSELLQIGHSKNQSQTFLPEFIFESETNLMFADVAGFGDTGGAGPLSSKVLERPPAESGQTAAAAVAAATGAPGGGAAAGGRSDAAAGGKAGARGRSTQNGRAAAMKAMGK